MCFSELKCETCSAFYIPGTVNKPSLGLSFLVSELEPEGKLHSSKEPGIKAPHHSIQIKELSPLQKGMDIKIDYIQLPADPSLWLVSEIP